MPIPAWITTTIFLCLCLGVVGGWVGTGMGWGRTSHTLSSPYLMLQAGQLRTGFFLQRHLTQSENCSLVLGTQLFVSQTLLEHCNSEAVEGSGPFCSWLWSLYVPLQRYRPTQSCHCWILSRAGSGPNSQEDVTDSKKSSLNAHQLTPPHNAPFLARHPFLTVSSQRAGSVLIILDSRPSQARQDTCRCSAVLARQAGLCTALSKAPCCPALSYHPG